MNKIIDALCNEDIFWSILLIGCGFLATILIIGVFISSDREKKYNIEMAKVGCTQTVAHTGQVIWDCRKDK